MMSALSSVISGAEPDRDDLRDLLGMVNETAARLQRTHEVLQTEVARLKGELAEANAQLKRSRSLAALGEMAAGIAHEVRNPLGSIELYAQMLEEDLAALPEQRELCTRIRRAVAGLDGIVRDVLHFARETRVRPESVDPRELVDQAVAQCDALMARHSVPVRTAFGGDVPKRIGADATLLVQSLSNVIRNAIEAMIDGHVDAPGLDLSVDVRRMRLPDGSRKRRVVFSVRDYGPGIAPEVVDRMFNPFFTTRATGTGLGLAIVHRVVDAHGGHIVVAPAPGGGAIVQICVPEDVPPDIEPAVAVPSAERLVHPSCMEAKESR